MVNMTMAIPDVMHAKMKKYSDIKWTEVARQAMEKKLNELEAENKAWKIQGQKHAIERGWSEAHELFKF
ncbi:MAG TPA: hypothetical protein PKK60_04050 [archaeon]|nr:hypothetical protein [archaeon]